MCPLYGQVLFVKGFLLYLGLSNCLLVVVHGKMLSLTRKWPCVAFLIVFS